MPNARRTNGVIQREETQMKQALIKLLPDTIKPTLSAKELIAKLTQ